MVITIRRLSGGVVFAKLLNLKGILMQMIYRTEKLATQMVENECAIHYHDI